MYTHMAPVTTKLRRPARTVIQRHGCRYGDMLEFLTVAQTAQRSVCILCISDSAFLPHTCTKLQHRTYYTRDMQAGRRKSPNSHADSASYPKHHPYSRKLQTPPLRSPAQPKLLAKRTDHRNSNTLVTPTPTTSPLIPSPPTSTARPPPPPTP